MSAITALESKILPVTKITVESEAGSRVFTVVMDFNAIARAEEVTGLDLSRIQNWQGMKPAQITAACWAGLDRYHPEITLREVGQWLAPAQWAQVWLMLFEQCFPGTLERIKQASLLKETTQGKDEPNPATTLPA